jgi:hypothetical protein
MTPWPFLVAGGVAASANWWAKAAQRSTLETIAKPLATVGAIAVAATSGGERAVVAWCVAALVLCLAGDVALLPAVDRFIVGLGAFAVGHLLFAVMFIIGGLHRWPLAGSALVACALLAGTAGVVIMRGAKARRLLRPVQVYLAVISAMAVVAWATGRAAAMLGSASFVISDALLGWREFAARQPSRRLAVAVMVTYHVAIFGLALYPRWA